MKLKLIILCFLGFICLSMVFNSCTSEDPIEIPIESDILEDIGINMAQGYYFGKPEETILADNNR